MFDLESTILQDDQTISNPRNTDIMKIEANRKLATVTLAVAFVASTAFAEINARQPVKVFILAGQSNMEGQGVVEMDHAKY